MAEKNRPDETGKTGPGNPAAPEVRDDDLDRRRRSLEATLAARRPNVRNEGPDARSSGVTGYGQAMKLSSEFIAGIVVGVGIGWVLDSFAGTSPWGLIVFLFLGFGAGVLNVLRSAGMVADVGLKAPSKDAGKPDEK